MSTTNNNLTKTTLGKKSERNKTRRDKIPDQRPRLFPGACFA